MYYLIIMLIPLTYLINKYNIKPTGVLHIGAHQAEELSDYNKHNINKVIWIEANPSLIPSLKTITEQYNHKVYNLLVSDVSNIKHTFYITNNGQSSSMLPLDLHIKMHPHIYVTKTVELYSKTLQDLVEEENIDMNDYDFINLDIQGSELLALKGLGDNISYINYIYTEVNMDHLYKDCCLIDELDKYLGDRGFVRVETKMTQYKWGDAFYIRKN